MEARSNRTLQRFEHRVEVPSPVVSYPVDEQSGRARNAVSVPLPLISLDPSAHLVALKIAFELIDVEPDRSSHLDELRLTDRQGAVEDLVVHLEEATLSGCCLGSTRRKLRARVGALVREVPKHVNQTIAERFVEPSEDL